MNKTILLSTIVFLLIPLAVAMAGRVRESVIAGTWYTGNPDILKRQIEGFLSQVPAASHEGRLVALISPHAGYRYSGGVAAHAYALLKSRPFETVLVIGPSHHAAFTGVSVYDQGEGFKTPLGVVPLDREFIAALEAADPAIRFIPEAHEQEHSVEIQLPFLQAVMTGFKLVPLVMGRQDPASCQRLAQALAACAKGKKVLLVASSDLSHYHSRKTAHKLDGEVAARVAAFDPEGLSADLGEGRGEACGGGPMVVIMQAAKILGADNAEVLKIGDSGDETGDTDQVVGYMSAAFWEKTGGASREKPEAAAGKMMVSSEEQALLKKIARESIESALAKKRYDLPEDLPPVLKTLCGAFVTLTEEGRLRGCIGHIKAVSPLAETVAEMARAAAFEDPRFSPVTAAEWPKIHIEISVLTPMERISDPAVVTPGTHGLYIRKGFYSGLLLPQVATEYGWDRVTFLEQTCRKAGLPKDAWKDPDAELSVFTAQVF